MLVVVTVSYLLNIIRLFKSLVSKKDTASTGGFFTPKIRVGPRSHPSNGRFYGGLEAG